MNYKNIGDTLTTAELNAYASLLANCKTLNDAFKIKKGAIQGKYGKYTFDLTNAPIVDNGVLITDETLSNPITVLLETPSQYATYTLNLKVLRYGETSLLDEEPQSEIIPLTVELTEDTEVTIPTTDLQEHDIILFDTNITVKHDKPEIKGTYVTGLQITAEPSTIIADETSTVTITATDLTTLPVPNKTIKIYKNGTLLDTLTTDNNGQCTKTITGTGAGLLELIAKYLGTTSNTFNLIDAFYRFIGSETFSDKFTFSNNLTTSTADNTLQIVNATAQTRYATLSNDGSTNLSFTTDDSFILEYDQYIGSTYFRSSICGQNCQPTLISDVWYHIRVEKNGTTIKWYINGELECTQTQTASGVISLAVGANSTSKIKNILLYYI